MGSDWRSERTKSPDLISGLPRDVIDGIMEYLPLCDAARMSVLSHKWRDIWLSTPQLVFDAEFCSRFIRTKHDAIHQYCSIVSKLLFQHYGQILKFSLHVPHMKVCPEVNQWLCFLSRNGVKDFSLQNHHRSNLIMLSSQLFSCVELEKLNIRCCVLGASSFSHLRKLVSLELFNVEFRKGTFEHFIAGCPLLEKLSLICCEGIDFEQVTTIDAPNLRHLAISRHLIYVKNAENLLSLSASITSGELTTKAVRMHKTSLRDLIAVLANSTKLEKLCFGSDFCTLLFKECQVSTTFEYLRILELSSINLFDWIDLFYVIKAIRMCPNLERLDISVEWNTSKNAQTLDYSPDIALHNLRWAKVGICIASRIELKLIELLLACSPVLETLSLSFITRVNKGIELRMLKQLIRFNKASPKVEIIGLDALNPGTSDSGTSVSSSDSSSSESDSD